MRRLSPFRVNSVRARILLLAVLTCLLLGAAAFGVVLLLHNSESSVISDSERHLTALSQSLAHDYTNQATYELQQGRQPALAMPKDPGSDQILALMTTVVLGREVGVEGGFYSPASDDLFGYAFPTHEGPGIKKDIPGNERPSITDVARKAVQRNQTQTLRFSGARDAIVFVATPIQAGETIVGSTWMMQRMPGINSRKSIRVLLGSVAFALAALTCALLAFLITTRVQSGVGAIMWRLDRLQQDLSDPRSAKPQLAEFENVLAGIDALSTALRAKIARERDLENQLRHQERLSALGQFAAGIAHEVRNPLATIRLRTQMTQRANGDSATQRNMAVIEEEIKRLDAMIERLLYFSRPIQLVIQPADLRLLCDNVLLAWSGRPQAVGIQFECIGAEDLECPVDSPKFRQVLENLVSNSIEALHTNHAQPGRITVRLSAEGQFAQIQVEDNGPGLSAEAQSMALNPFFTTKDTGTGLGLSIAYEIVKAHEGELRLENRVEGGVITTVRLPLAPSARKETDR
jgi:signal transduction histidine kinase